MKAEKGKHEIESDVQSKIQIWCGEHDIIAIRVNVGTFLTMYGSYINAGPPNGYPDLTLLGYNGHSVYCECKQKNGRVRDDQKKMHAELRRRGFVVLVPKSLEQFIKEFEEMGLMEYMVGK